MLMRKHLVLLALSQNKSIHQIINDTNEQFLDEIRITSISRAEGEEKTLNFLQLL